MPFFQSTPAKFLFGAGLMLLVLAGGAELFTRFFGSARLPGDIVIRRGNFTFYFPVVTCIVLSVMLSLVLRLLRKG